VAVVSGLCQIEAEIGRSLTLSHEVAHTRLQWWGEECERTARGEPRHPLTRALAGELPPPLLACLPGLADTAVWDLARATFETRRETSAYCERWAAALIEPAALHAQRSTQVSADAKPRWRALGAALREIELLAHVRDEARAGRLRLPLDELERAGVVPEALTADACPPAVAALLAARHETLRRTLEAAVLDVTPALQPTVRGLLVWTQLAWRLSRQAQLALPHPLPRAAPGGLTAAWAAWRAARAAQRGAYRLQYRP
jgi:phytoene synthase